MKDRWFAILAASLLAAPLVLVMPAAAQSASDRDAQDWSQAHLERIQRQVEAELARAHQELRKKMAEWHAHQAVIARSAQESAAKIQAELRQHLSATQAQQRVAIAAAQQAALRAHQEVAQALRDAQRDDVFVWTSDTSSGWLGVTITEVSAEKVKELKLPAERGALVTEVETDSPAAKAGLKSGDVITEFNGVRIEGTEQLRRLIRETPAGRTVQLTVWRDARSQSLSAQLAAPQDRFRSAIRVAPRDFSLTIPRFETFVGDLVGRPVLGVSIEDVSGQLGSYFGVPDGEGVLIREVNSGSPAEKAGLKAGDVIIKVAGQRVRNSSELRAKLREKRSEKIVAIGVIRSGREAAFNVEIEQPRPPERRLISRRITL
jgi:serine protease Do